MQVLIRAEVIGSSCEGSVDTVPREVGGAGRVLSVEVSVGGFSVDEGGLIRVDEYVKEG
jgi:hypothetical protein